MDMKRLFAYLFVSRVGNSTQTEVVDEVVDTDPQEDQDNKRLKFSIFNTINRLLAFFFIVSFLYILAIPLIPGDPQVPGVIEHGFSGVIGYFIGAILRFVEET